MFIGHTKAYNASFPTRFPEIQSTIITPIHTIKGKKKGEKDAGKSTLELAD